MADSTETPSVPPNERSKTERFNRTLSAFTDWAAIASLTFLTACGHVPEDAKGYVLGAIALIGSPSAVGAMLNRLGLSKGTGGSASALLLMGASKIGIGGAIKHTLMGVCLMMAIGCGASVYESTLDVVNRTSDSVTEVQPAIIALCHLDPGQRCTDARKAYDVAAAAVAAAHDALEVYRVTGDGLDAVGEAVRRAAESAREVARVSVQ